MQFNIRVRSLVLASMAASLVGATALPAVEQRAEEAAQFDGHLFVCIDAGYSGSCLNIGFYSQVCQNFPTGFDDQISSVGPDNGWNCHLFIDDNCNLDQGDYWIKYPGLGLLTYGNDAFSSFSCYRT